MQFALEIVSRTRQLVGKDFIIIFRISLLDLVEKGCSWKEITFLAKSLEEVGVTMLNSGIGWHEARIPTIATKVPRKAFTWVTRDLRKKVNIPVIATNRINTPMVAEEILSQEHADAVCLARPLLADPDFVLKAIENKPESINTCIACNEACLDFVFERKRATCMVNPQACYETELTYQNTTQPKRIAVIGAGPAGLSAATVARERGHDVYLYERDSQIGGQFNLAKRVPGKAEFNETLRYFEFRLKQLGVKSYLGQAFTPEIAKKEQFDEIIIATGVTPRVPKIPGIDSDKVVTYVEAIKGLKPIGQRVAIIGAGGIGFDTAELLTHVEGFEPSLNIQHYCQYWGIDTTHHARGGIAGIKAYTPKPEREIYLLQRKDEKLGKRLGKTTGWVHRLELKRKGVHMLGGVSYEKIDAAGLHIRHDDKSRCLAVDHIIICAGQSSCCDLQEPLQQAGFSCHLIGGAQVAAELDAVRAIREGAELAAKL